MRDHVLLYLNGRPLRVEGDDAFLTLAEFLRRRRRLTGTKVVCAEGDCGSCAVMVGRVDAESIHYAAVTSCIQLVFQLDGAHVVTVEGLRDGDQLNPIQHSMVACHGAQCGFCTPGIVVSLYDLMHDGRPVTSDSITRALVGNLCRCTGYDSITRSALAVDPGSVKPIDALYPPAPIITALTKAGAESVSVGTPTGRKFFKPTTLDQAVAFRAANPTCAVIAGATDLGVVHNKGTREIRDALSLGGIAELRSLHVADGVLHVGAGATLSALERAALEHLPELGRFLAWFGSPLIKNAGTIAGNVVTGSPIGDTIPALFALGAVIEIAGLSGRRSVPIDQFYTGYRKTVLGPDELVAAVHIPIPAPGATFKLYKVSRRKDLDISSFSAAILLTRTAGSVADVHIVYGGVGAMVMRMTHAEDALRGRPPTLEHFEAAAVAAAAQVTPITDVRGSDQYRRTLARNILLRFWHETFGVSDDGNNHNGDGSPHTSASRLEPALHRSPEGGR